MKPVIIIATLLLCAGFSTTLYNKHVVAKQDYIDSFCVGLQPIKKFITAQSTISLIQDKWHTDFYPISRFYFVPAHIDLYPKAEDDTLLSVEVTAHPDSAINSILQHRKVFFTNESNGYTYKLSTR